MGAFAAVTLKLLWLFSPTGNSVRTYERHQLKQDKFAESVTGKISWVMENRSRVIAASILAGLVLIAAIGATWLWNYRNEKANAALGDAMQTYSAEIVPAGTPSQPGTPTFTSSQARARAAYDQFQKVAGQYGLTKAGQMAKYMAATSAIDMGDLKSAEMELKTVADSGNKDVAALAKLSLAGLYRDQQRTSDALQLYKQLVDKPTDSVSKATAQLALASLYESSNQSAEAGKLYSEIMKNDPRSAAASIANQHLSELK
jgi:predicted negative regulator of RcsB-dependent stress response